MNRRRLMWIGIAALVAGGVLSSLVYRWLQQRIPVAAETVNVVIAASDIHAGSRILDQDLLIVKYPAQLAPEKALHSKDNAIGRGAVVEIARGDYVLPAKFRQPRGRLP